MTAAATTSTQTPLGRLTALPNWAWSIVALAVIALLQFLLAGETFTGYLGDPDDAARLVQVREFIAGSPWLIRRPADWAAKPDCCRTGRG